jgi:hypothetical protein
MSTARFAELLERDSPLISDRGDCADRPLATVSACVKTLCGGGLRHGHTWIAFDPNARIMTALTYRARANSTLSGPSGGVPFPGKTKPHVLIRATLLFQRRKADP